MAKKIFKTWRDIQKTWFHRKKKRNRWAFVVQDEYFKKAQFEWYRARSIYKLQELQERFNLIKRNSKVIDIWARPGSFLQYIAKIVSGDIDIVWVDINSIDQFPQQNIKLIKCDIFNYQLLRSKLSELDIDYRFDIITSDIAPHMSGIYDVDQYASVELNIAITEFSDEFLLSGWSMILKVFKWADFNDLYMQVKKRFNKIHSYKPLASRDSSKEEYLICMDKK